MEDELYDFFYDELKTLKSKTGMLQWEKLNEAKDPAKDIDELIDFMIVEVMKPPFDVVRLEVKKRVISRAIIEDKEFIGLSAKFVRKALNAWWEVNGDRVMMAMNEKDPAVYEKKPLTPEQNDFVNTMLESYKRRLQSESSIKKVPDVKNPSVEGAEWKSNIERKATGYSNGMTLEQYEFREKILRAGSELYKDRYSLNLQRFVVKNYEVYAENEQDAKQIYEMANQNSLKSKS